MFSPMDPRCPPSTPSRSHSSAASLRYQPRNSSPLVPPSSSFAHAPDRSSPVAHRHSSPPPVPTDSPTTAAQERRKGQYKSLVSCRTPEAGASAKRLFSSGSSGTGGSSAFGNSKRSGRAFFSSLNQAHPEDPTKIFLRERFQARCLERMKQARRRAVSERRIVGSSDAGFFETGDEEMDCDDEETDDAVMQDELFRRIMQSTNHRAQHAYRLSYSLEVGSSFDPDLEDVSAWESELRAEPPPSTSTSSSTRPTDASRSAPTASSMSISTSTSTPMPSSSSMQISEMTSTSCLTPDDLDEEELRTYAEEYAILADFADIDPLAEESWSDLEEEVGSAHHERVMRAGGDQDMDTS
ncbi:hypothetical protein ID866_9908 [Astraeus odoratus]|nr:hypothetical protein ID866_9908 [Astraeus odoratus]